MKIFDLFLKVFSVFSFLTIGSLLIMVSFHVVSVNELMLDIQNIYSSFGGSFQVFMIGFVFIFSGLAFAKMLIKQTRYSGGVVYTGPLGRTSVSLSAIEDIVKKVLRKRSEIINFDLKCRGFEKKVEVKIRLEVQLQQPLLEFSEQVQQDVRSRLMKVLELDNEVSVFVDIHQLKDADAEDVVEAIRIGKAL